MISARGSRHGILWSRKLSQRSNMTRRLSSRQNPSRDMDNCLFFLIFDLVIFYRHAESCQLMAFVYSYFIAVFYRHAESCQFAAFIINPIFFFFSFRDGYFFISSIMGQSSRLLYEISNGAIISEKQIFFLAASPFGIPDPIFGLYDVYIYHHVFI